MAEVLALVGAASAGVQFADAAAKLFNLATTLRAKLKEAPEKVKRLLNQIDQLITLAEWMKQTEADLPSLSGRLPQSISAAGRSGVSWVEGALMDLTTQAQVLQHILEDMVQEVDHGKLQNLWKGILTVKREREINSALDEIERHKATLNMWLGQRNSRPLNDLCHSVEYISDGVGKIDQNLQGLSTDLQKYTTANASSMETFTQELMQELRAVRHEVKTIRYQANTGRVPRRKKSPLQEQGASSRKSLDIITPRYNSTKRRQRITPQVCSCQALGWASQWSVTAISRLSLSHYKRHTKDCPLYKSVDSYATTVCYYIHGTLFKDLVRLKLWATFGSGGLFLGILTQTDRRVRNHHLESFFNDLYWSQSRNYKSLDELVKIAHKQLWNSFNSGLASPSDVDDEGRTLLHLHVDNYPRTYGINEFELWAQITKLLISMRVKPDTHDSAFRTPLQLLLCRRIFHLTHSLNAHLVNGDLIEWTGILPSTVMGADLMMSCMRRWSESIEDWGYPYICSILLRKSTAELQAFISHGMQPAEETARCLTPLHLAAAANWPEAIRLLLAGGADKYAQDSLLELPIDIALRSKCSEAVELLLDGDCVPQFTTPRRGQSTTIPQDMLEQIAYGDKRIRDALLRALIRLRPFLGDLRPYHDLMKDTLMPEYSDILTVFELLISGGYDDLEAWDSTGMTPLMVACKTYNLELAKLFIKHKVSMSTPHRDTSLTAGHYLVMYWPFRDFGSNVDLVSNLLQCAFNASTTVHSHCLCSPEGFTPLTAIRTAMRANRKTNLGHLPYFYYKANNQRYYFELLIETLRPQSNAAEEQARAWALGEVFDRLEMTHTCINMREPWKPISEEDRVEIQLEEEEFNGQLQKIMGEYDLGRAEFSGGPADFLEHFLDSHELDLPSEYVDLEENEDDRNVLGPGKDYQSIRFSFSGELIRHRHRERVTEENMLALLFGDNNGR